MCRTERAFAHLAKHLRKFEQARLAFQRLHAVDAFEGSGIGLSLVQQFAQLHGGRAWVEERPGGGASFRVHLPQPAGGNGRRD